MRLEDLGNHTIIKTGNLDANAEVHGGKYPFFTCSKEPKQIDHFAFDGEFVVVAGNGDLNVKYFNGKFNAYQRTYAISPKETVHGKYLYYFLEKYLVKLRELSIGGVIKYIKIGNLTEAKIPLPPLPQQKKIANILDAADAVRQNDKALIAKYDELTQALFLDMFGDPVSNPKGWDEKSLNELCTKITDGTHQGPKFIDSGVPFLLVSNIVNNQICFDVKKYISEEDFLVLTKSTPIEKGDILYTSVGSYGNPAIVKDNRKFCFQRHIAHLKPDHDQINVFFLHAMMASPLVKRQADSFAIGVAMKTLNLKTIKAFRIFLPEMLIQNQFAERVAVIEQQKAIAQKSLEKSEELFNSLLQKAFKEELV
jgi:type I restriction enzyme S subunit